MDRRPHGSFLRHEPGHGRAERGDICVICKVKIKDGEIGDKHVSLVCPPSEKSRSIKVHGLGWRDVRDYPSFRNLWPFISKLMERADAFVARNAVHVREVLYGACRQSGFKAPEAPFCCTAKGAEACIELPSCELADVCGQLGIRLNEHEALGNTKACAEIFLFPAHGHALKDMEIAAPRAKKTRRPMA